MSGKPAARVGDKVAGNVIVSGSATVLIGDAGQGCADKACKGSPSVGSPVNPMLGVKVLPGETDFALAAPSPFAFTRSYASDDARIGPLGQGWSIPGASLYLEVSETATVMVDPQGRRITFDALAPGESLFSPSESLWIRRGGPVPGEGAPPPKAWDGRWIGVPEAVQRNPHAIVAMSASDHDAHVFLAGPTRWRLAQVVDRNGYATEYQWSATGDLRAICDSAGRIYALVYVAHPTTRAGDPGLRLAGVVLAFDPGRDDRPRATFDPLAPDNDWLVRYGHDAEGDLVEVTDRMGHAVRYFGYRQHIMVRHGQPGGIDVRYTYDMYSHLGKVLTQQNLGGLDYSFEYHRDRTVVTDSLGRVQTYHFAGEAGLRRLVKHVKADGGVVEREYDHAKRWVATVDPLNRVTRVRLDGEGRRLGTTYPDGTTDLRRHDPQTGDLLETEDALGRRVSVVRDAHGHPVSVTGPDGAVTRYVYGLVDLPDRPAQIMDAKGGVAHIHWTRLGQIESYTDCSGHTTRYGYDRDGNVTHVTDALGHVTRYGHDRAGRILEIVSPDGAVTRSQRDSLGRIVRTTDALGQVTRLDRDRSGRVVCHTNPQGHTRHFAYDPAGRLHTLTNENGAHFRIRYDADDRVIEETGFDDRRRQYRYTLAGELMEIEDAGGAVTRFERDAMGRVTALHVPSTDAEPAYAQRYRYDAAGQILEAHAPDATVLMTYDAVGRLTSETQRHADGWQYHHQHRHDALGEREISQYDGAPEVRWLTYGHGHLHGVRVGEFGLDFERDARHREVRRWALQGNVPTGLESLRQYDATGEMVRQHAFTMFPDPAAVRWTRDYRYDERGQLIHVQDSRAGEIRYRYDLSGRLIGSNHAGRAYAYHFDPAGNRVEVPQEAVSGAWPARIIDNRVTHLNGLNYRYDSMGSVTERITADGDRLEMSYDGQRRMVVVRRSAGAMGVQKVARYRYDAFGRRISKDVAEGPGLPIRTRFGWDADRMVAEVGDSRCRTVVYEPGSFVPMFRLDAAILADPLGEFRPLLASADVPTSGGGGPQVAWMLFQVDRLGTPTGEMDGLGQVWDVSVPDDWKAVAQTRMGLVGIRFQGQYQDDETGLFYNRHRFYDGESGIFLSQDPVALAGGMNFYGYVHGNPVNFTDSIGLWVDGTYDRSTGMLTLVDKEKGVTITKPFESGGKPYGDPIPAGDYDILERGGKDGFFRLESVDSNYGDDLDQGTGRNQFRLHRPGLTVGCIAAKDKKDWDETEKFIKSTKSNQVTVQSKSRWPWSPSQEVLPRYGKIRVIN